MKKRELFDKLNEIDKFKKEYLSGDRNGPYVADEMYLKLLSRYLRGKDSISKDTLKQFEERLSSRQSEYFTSLLVTNEMRISREIQDIDRKLEEWNNKMDFVKLPFDCPEFTEFPYGISRCIEDTVHKEDYSLDTLIRNITIFVTNDSAQKYPLYKALFFYLASVPRGKYIEYLEYVCMESSTKEFFRMLFQETAQFIAASSYANDTALLQEKRDNLSLELAAMSNEKKKTVCLIYVDGIARNVT